MKLQRAEEHFGELLAHHSLFLERNPYRVLRESEARDHHYAWRVKVVEAPPLEKWGSLAGECVHALRSALDHTAYALVNRDEFVTDKTEFPVFYDRAPTEADYAKKLPGVDPEVIAEVEAVQPYKRGGLNDPLYLVHQLDIHDKHRRLNVVTSTLIESGYGIEGGDLEILDWGAGPFEDGAVVGRFRAIPTPDAAMHVYTNFAFGIALGEGEPLAGKPLIPALEWLRVYTGGIVARFDRFFG
jgi:hypothetical protein